MLLMGLMPESMYSIVSLSPLNDQVAATLSLMWLWLLRTGWLVTQTMACWWDVTEDFDSRKYSDTSKRPSLHVLCAPTCSPSSCPQYPPPVCPVPTPSSTNFNLYKLSLSSSVSQSICYTATVLSCHPATFPPNCNNQWYPMTQLSNFSRWTFFTTVN